MHRKIIVRFFFYLLFLILLNKSHAQTLDMQAIPGDQIQVGLSLNKAFFINPYETTTGSAIERLSFNIPLNSRYNLIGSIPYNYTIFNIPGYSSGPEDWSNSITYKEHGIGNIFIGLQTNREIINDRRSVYTFGVYLPTADQDAGYLGWMANFYSYQDFAYNTVGLYFNYAYHKISDNGITYGIEVGPNFYIPTHKYQSMTNVTLHYGIGLGYSISGISLNTELIGMALLNSWRRSYDNYFSHILDIGAGWNRGVIRPNLFYRFYLTDNFKNYVDGGIGASINFYLN